MSANTKLSIKSTSYADSKKTVTDTINYVNPNISNATALELAQRLNALTNNSYKQTEKIQTTELDSIIKQTRTFGTFSIHKGNSATPSATFVRNQQTGVYEVTVPTNYLVSSNSTIWFSTQGNEFEEPPFIFPCWRSETSYMNYAIWEVRYFKIQIVMNNQSTRLVEGQLFIPETDDFYQTTIDFKITLED